MLDTAVNGKLQLASENLGPHIEHPSIRQDNMNEPLIKVDGVDKIYRIWSHPRARLTAALTGRMARKGWLPEPVRRLCHRHQATACREFFAVRNISFEIGRGETVGIVGRNGAGKSTILKIIAGTLSSTRGTVAVNGRVAAMLELASGFEREFTGRENVFLSASILGLKERDTAERLDDIIAFADIGDFLDQPVKTYSSGMLVRLAFAVHTAVEPEVLIVDEALSVGDETFRRKCFARLERLKANGTTLLFVSHDTSAVINLTERALLFHEGEIIMEGEPKKVVESYQRYCHAGRAQMTEIARDMRDAYRRGAKAEAEEATTGEQSEPAGKPVLPEAEPNNQAAEVEEVPGAVVRPAKIQYGDGEAYDPAFLSKSINRYEPEGAEIKDWRLLNGDGEPVNILQRRRTYRFEYTVHFSKDCHDVTFAMLIKTLKGLELGGSRVLPWDRFIEKVEAGQSYRVGFDFQTLLMPGVYFINAGVEGLIEGKRAYAHRVLDAIVFRVMTEKELMPTGLVDFLVEPRMEKVEIARV